MRAALIAVVAAGCVPRLYTDAVEVVSDWVPPENTWSLSTPPADLEGEGYDEGDVVPDFRLADQHGDEVSLWQFYGDVVVLDLSTIWCVPCQVIAEDTEETWQQYRDQGFVYVTVIQENFDGGPPGAEDVQLWADNFGITAPVVLDVDKSGVAYGTGDRYPVVLVIGRNMRVRDDIAGPDDPKIRAAIEAAL